MIKAPGIKTSAPCAAVECRVGTPDPHCWLRTVPSLLFPSASTEPVPWARTVWMQPLQALPSAAAGPHGALGPRGKSDIDGGAAEAGKARKEALVVLGRSAHPRPGADSPWKLRQGVSLG